MSKIKEAKLLFAKLEKLSKQANMSVSEYILKKGTVEEGSADSRGKWGGELFTMKDMSYMVFYIQPKWETQIVMILEGYYGNRDGGDDEERIDYALWRRREIIDMDFRLTTMRTVYDLELETTTADDRWGAKKDWVYLNLDDVLVNSSFLNWKHNPLEVTE
jgi:hypothetical protein